MSSENIGQEVPYDEINTIPAVEEEAAAVEDEASAVEEEAPAVEEEAAAVEDEASAVEEEAPAGEEEAPAGEEEASAVEEEVQVVEEDAQVVEEEASAVEEEVPAVEEEAPACEEEAPVVEEEASAVEEEVPAVEEEVPAVEEEAPAGEEEAPVVEEEASAVEEEVQVVEEDAQVVEEDAQVVEEYIEHINKNKTKTLKDFREKQFQHIKSNRNDDTSENDLNDNSEDLGGVKHGEPINYNKLYETLEKYCNLKRQTHWMCAKYYNNLDRMFLIPSICLSSFSGIASFLSSVESFEVYQTELSVGVGIMASCTTLLQSFSNAFGFSTKTEAHQNATEAFDQIITKIRFQRINPKNDVKDTDFISELENQIVETKQRCKYVVPEWIEEEYRDNKFNSLKSTLSRNVYKQLANIKTDKYLTAAKKKEYNKIDLEEIDVELGLKDDTDNKYCF